MDYKDEFLKVVFDSKIIKVNTNEPFPWSSKNLMPIYCNFRLLQSDSYSRACITDGFLEIINENNLYPDIIAGTSESGIAPATTLADSLNLPLTWVRKEVKEHGNREKIDSIDKEAMNGKEVFLIEDVISFGGSARNSIETIRDYGANCSNCLSIFNYDFKDSVLKNMNPLVNTYSILTLDDVLDYGENNRLIKSSDINILKNWKQNPISLYN